MTAFTFPWIVNSFPLRRGLVCLFSFIAVSFRLFPPCTFLYVPVNHRSILDARHVYLYITAIKRRPKRDRYFLNDSSVQNTDTSCVRASIWVEIFSGAIVNVT